MTNISKSFTHKMAAKTVWHRYETKLRHCHSVYRHLMPHLQTVPTKSKKTITQNDKYDGSIYSKAYTCIHIYYGLINIQTRFLCRSLCCRRTSRCSRRHLRSANRHLLAVPRFPLNTYGRRAFSAAGPMAWNALPDFIRDPTSTTDCFRRLLKT